MGSFFGNTRASTIVGIAAALGGAVAGFTSTHWALGLVNAVAFFFMGQYLARRKMPEGLSPDLTWDELNAHIRLKRSERGRTTSGTIVVWWKIFACFNFVLLLIGSNQLLADEPLIIAALALATGALSSVGGFAYAFNYRLFTPLFWKVSLILLVAFDLFGIALAIYRWNSDSAHYSRSLGIVIAALIFIAGYQIAVAIPVWRLSKGQTAIQRS